MNSPISRPPIEKIAVFVPTYNERENLPIIVDRIRRAVPTADIVVLDDNSPDGTGDVADELAASDSHVLVRHRKAKEGLGAAYLEGFTWAVENDYDVVIQIDADGSHPAEELPAMISKLANADVVIGSRWTKGGSVVNWPAHRKALSVGGNTYIKLLLGMDVKDATAGFRVFRAQALRDLGFASVHSTGYCFQIELSWRAVLANQVVVEHPIVFTERERGESKMSGSIMRESLANVTRWGIDHRVGQIRAALGGSKPRSTLSS